MKKQKETPPTLYLTVDQYARKKGVHKNRVYPLLKDGTIVPNTKLVEGKRLIEWDKYKDVVIGDKKTTIRRRIINEESQRIKEEVFKEIRKEL